MSQANAFYAQSGGVTSVINASACGVLETAKQYADNIGTVYAGKNGILGALREQLIDTSVYSDADIAALKHTPGGAFGSCRFKLTQEAEYERLLDVFEAHNIRYFFYNGGGDSQDTTHKVSELCKQRNYPMACIGIPKTIDNDLYHTDNCPGFGSVAKYIATSVREAGMDVASMAETSTKVFVLEVMGRHAGWIAASAGLASEAVGEPPHVILFPEISFDKKHFLDKVQHTVETHGYCVIAASEGIRDANGRFLTETNQKDAFGHAQLGGVAPHLAHMIQKALGYKYHWAVSDYLQRSARHIASATDVEQAYALGKAAVDAAVSGTTDRMMALVRSHHAPYRWEVGEAPLADVANREKTLPRDFITEDGFHITDACRAYLAPLIAGEAYPPMKAGLPDYIRLAYTLAPQKLAAWQR